MGSPIAIISSSKPDFTNKFGLCQKKITFKITPTPEGVSDIEWLEKGVDHIVDYVKEDASDTDKIGFAINSPHFRGTDAYFALKPAYSINTNDILHVISGLIQSNSSDDMSKNLLQNSIGIEVTRVRIPVNYLQNTNPKSNIKKTNHSDGNECLPSPNDYETFKNYCKNKRGIVCIDNADNLSLPKAIVVGKALVKKDPKYELIRKNKKNRQCDKAKKLLQKAKIVVPTRDFGLSELKQLNNHLKKYNLNVYQYKQNGYELQFNGAKPNALHNINLIRNNGHYNLLTKLNK